MEITIGTTCTKKSKVTDKLTAAAVGSGDLPVYATPMMIALMEDAATSCLKPFLDKESTSVGTEMSISHLSATPVGMQVSATAEIVKVEGRQVLFKVTAADACGPIGEGTHTRFIVGSKRFVEKATGKLQK